jgi:hypothetical protein
MAEAVRTNTEVGEGVDPIETYDDALEAGYFGLKKDPRPNEDYTVAGAVSRADELFADPVEDEGAPLARRGRGRPPKNAERKEAERRE